MPGQKDTTTVMRTASDEEYLTGLRKEADKMESPLPSTEEMMRNAQEGAAFSERYRTLYGVADYRVPQDRDFLRQRRASTPLFNSRVMEDQALRSSIAERTRSGRLLPAKTALGTETERELAFRSKEESYQKKTSEQEKAAMERNEPIVEVDTEMLKAQALELKEKLAVEIQEDNLFAMGEREYQKQYLAVINDLIKTRASKGHLFGNYSKHIALAEEKYRFYSTERERIIGKEQAKLLMAKPEYRAKLDEMKKAEPMPDYDLTSGFNSFDVYQAYSADQAALAKALREYRECSAKIYELRKRLEALDAVEDSELKATVVIIDKNDQREEERKGVIPSERVLRNRKVIPAPVKGTDLVGERALSESYGPGLTPANGLHSFKRSLELEMDALRFHADASLLCVRHLMNPTGEQNSELSAHAGYIMEHFGVDLRLSDPYDNDNPGYQEADKKLLHTAIARRVGLEDTIPDMGGYRDNAWFRSRGYMLRSAQTGYELQSISEKIRIEQAASRVFDKFLEDPEYKSYDDKKKFSLLESCTDMFVLTQDQSAGTAVVKDEDAPAKKEELKRHMKSIAVIRDSTAAPEDVTEAVKGELELVEDAFADISFMMNEGETAKIFTEKKHGEIFSHTALMPTFERKTRLLRDLVSSMLKRGDILEQLEQEPKHKDLRKKLFDKWLFMNRALSFVDYRVQVMRKGYNTPAEVWAHDTSMVKDFREGADYSLMFWGKDQTGSVPVTAPAPAAAAAAGDAEVSADGKKRYEYMDKHVRKEYYESPVFRTREQQRAAIKQDLWKGMELSSYTAAAHAIRLKLADVTDRKRRASRKDYIELLKEETLLQRDLRSMDQLIESRRAEIDRRAAEILETVKEPDTAEQDLAEGGAKALAILSETKADDPVMKEIGRRMRQILDPAETPDKETALQQLIELRDYMGTQYMEETKAFLERQQRDLASMLALDEEPRQQYFRDRTTQFQAMLDKASLGSMDRIAGHLGTTYQALGNAFTEPYPVIYRLMAETLGMIKSIEASDKTGSKRVSFDDKVDVRRIEIRDRPSGERKERRTDRTLTMEEEKAFSDTETAIYREAVRAIGEQQHRMKAASGELDTEQTGYMSKIRRLGEDEMKTHKDLSPEDIEFLSDTGCLLIPLLKEEAAEHKEGEEADKALKEETAQHIRNMLTLKEGDTAEPAALGKALTDTIQLVNRAFGDLEAFSRTEQGLGILKARKPLDVSRRPEEPEKPDNYDQELKGLAAFRYKAIQLYQVIDLVFDHEVDINEETRMALNEKVAKLGRLIRFLDRRVELIEEAKTKPDKTETMTSKARKREYIHELRDIPEEWSLDAFSWERK